MTGGLHKGRKLDVPKDVKPTLSKVRESVFNILKSELGEFEGLSFLDMFSGSGIMAIEAASREFKVTAVEKNFVNSRLIKASVQKLEAPVNVISSDSLRVIKKLEKFDVIYIDPPWDYDYNKIVELAAQNLLPEGFLVCESDNKKPTSELIAVMPSNVKLLKEKLYGRCKLSFYKLKTV